jgi:hypothetical protein
MSFKEKKQINFSNYFISTEILFIMLPLLVVYIIDASKGEYFAIFNKADLSFCSILFSGQLIIKLVSVLLKEGKTVHWQFVAFEIGAIICIGLIPALLFLVFMQEKNVQLWVKIAQVVWFIAMVFIYFEIGGYAQEKEDKKN